MLNDKEKDLLLSREKLASKESVSFLPSCFRVVCHTLSFAVFISDYLIILWGGEGKILRYFVSIILIINYFFKKKKNCCSMDFAE